MKASKLIVLAGGILGILAFFLPLVSVTRADVTKTVSAYQIVKGLDQVQSEVGRAGARGELSAATSSRAQNDLGAVKGIVMALFAPALLLAMIGGIGVKRRRFGRVAGTFSLLLGLVSLGIGSLMRGAAEGDSGIGMTFLLLTGIAGIVGGILALAKPERASAVAAPALATAPARLAA
jgi:hypothetical protein